jgi:hypothetical protein
MRTRAPIRPLLLLMLPLLIAASGASRKCGRVGEQLHLNSLRATITDELLRASYLLALQTPPRCLKEEVMIPHGDTQIPIGTVTSLFGRICQMSPSAKAVDYFVKYRLTNWSSADEEFSLVLERVFVSKPEEMLQYAHSAPDSVRTQLLNDIVWGFLSNRIYGPVDPLQGKSRHSIAPGEPLPEEVLNKRNYKQIFTKLNEKMPAVMQQFPSETNYVLEEIRKYLETWGVEY